MNEIGSNAGIGFGSLLALVFIALKLCHVIAWSWVWVLSPLWIGAIFNQLLFIFCIFVVKKME